MLKLLLCIHVSVLQNALQQQRVVGASAQVLARVLLGILDRFQYSWLVVRVHWVVVNCRLCLHHLSGVLPFEDLRLKLNSLFPLLLER